jgi:HK97 family phage major capsid protein
MTDQVKELGEKIASYQKSVAEAQDASTKESKKHDALIAQVEEKASKKAAEQADEIQKLQMQLGAVEKTAEYIEKAVSRIGGSPGDGPSEMEEKAAEQTARYLRTGTAMDDDVAAAVVTAMCSKSFHGVAEHRRDNEIKTLIAGVNPQGGYFIRPERSATMIKRIFETSPIRNIANIETTASDSMEFVIDDDEAAFGGWVGETSSRGNTNTPDIGLLTIPAHELFSQPLATQKMLDDAGFDIESWLSRKVTNKMSREENTAFVTGDGSQKPRGFLSLAAWAAAGVYERNKIEQISSGAAADFTADGIKKLQNSLIEAYQANAVFGIKRASWENVITLKDGTGAYLLDPRSMKVGDDLTLLGKRVIFMDDMPVVAADALGMVYGDFSVGYTILDRIGFRVIRDDLTDKPRIKFYTTKRTGGDVTNFEALKIQKLEV